jgi:hypothetical protein
MSKPFYPSLEVDGIFCVCTRGRSDDVLPEVQAYVSRAKEKFGVRTLNELLREAIR